MNRGRENNLSRRGGGSITLLVVIFAGIMVMVFAGTTGFILAQNRLQARKADKEKAMQIAEAGLDYYRWFLSHYPDDLRDGTGSGGPYEHEYFDPEGGAIGKFSLKISGNGACGSVSSIDISSTGWTDENPAIKRTVAARYSRPSVAEYAYIIDDDVWAGSDRKIKGKYHSNGGIRMDGENDSLVTSAKEKWNCTASFGCDSPYEVKNGVFGSGGGSDLWRYPVEKIDFTSITLDLAKMKQAAKDYGLYIAPSGAGGYHAVFKSDGTVDLYKVTRIKNIGSYSGDEGWHWSPEYISRESFYNNYPIPSGCGLIFVEDNLWIEGEVSGKVSIASADLLDANKDTDVWLSGDVTYTKNDGSDGLLVIGERNVRVPLYSPDDMELEGIFVAQKGHFGRDYYTSRGSYGVPYSLRSYVKRDFLKITGSIVSKGRVGTKWGSANGTFLSGYEKRQNSYDRKLMADPPPMTPFSDDEYLFVNWEEKQ